MSEEGKKAVKIERLTVHEVKHTLKGARLLYSAPHYVLRGPIYLIFVCTFTALLYSFWGKVDNLVTCSLVLKGEYNTIQSPTGGIVKRLFVTNGAQVDLGSKLVKIQFKTMASQKSEEESLLSRKSTLEKESRFQARELKNQEVLYANLTNSLEILENNKDLLKTKIEQDEREFEALLQSANQKIETVQIQLGQARREVESFQKQLEVARQRFAEDQSLFDQNLLTKPELLDSEARYDGVKKALADARDRILQMKISLIEAEDSPRRLNMQKEQRLIQHNEERLRLESRIAEIKHQTKSMTFTAEKNKILLLDQLETVETAIKNLRGINPTIEYDESEILIRSAYSGTVTEVHTKTGELISFGQPLVNIVRDSEPIYAEVLVQNQDIGLIKLNQEVKIKYFAFPYQEYGIKKGKIAHIPPKPVEVPGGESSMYKVKVALNEFTVKTGRRHVPLNLGLQGMAEIKTGDKRLIEIIFTPISRFFIKEE